VLPRDNLIWPPKITQKYPRCLYENKDATLNQIGLKNLPFFQGVETEAKLADKERTPDSQYMTLYVYLPTDTWERWGCLVVVLLCLCHNEAVFFYVQ
jgi:hypothetical protein